MPNHLSSESSPYLLQHQNNPVDWYPWGPEAVQRAKKQNKPIFLSIGYSACHWCHVMEHESFEDKNIARYLNEHFISIKVDREERPDLDQIYMNAVQIMTGRGGWPMSVFLTPDLKPFYGGTYWPPTPKMGMPGFEQILVAVHDAWQNRREAALKQAEELTGYLQTIEQGEADEPRVQNPLPRGEGGPDLSGPGEGPSAAEATALLESAERALRRSFDARHGGFGSAPKFPHSMDLQLLLRMWKRNPRPALLDMVTLTLDKMAAGGIYDHLAGGFARYSVDERWLVPHFEKMLYDNALLTSAYLDAYLAVGQAALPVPKPTGQAALPVQRAAGKFGESGQAGSPSHEHRFARIARETCDYILRYMTDAEGGFHSTEDADSEGEEGKFYVWTPTEIKHILGEKAGERFCYVYDVSDGGNFEHGHSILNLPKTIAQCASLKGWDEEQLEAELSASRAKLLAERDKRVRPSKDDKVLVSWNGLMIDALARAGVILNQNAYLSAAEKAATFVLDKISRHDGRLLHTWRGGTAKLDAYLDDYACFINSLVTLYEATFHERWIDEAARLADLMLAHFADKTRGGFYFTADDHEQLIARNKDLHDASVPSGNAMAATVLIRLGKLTGRTNYLEAAGRTLEIARPVMEQTPTGAGQMLIALDLWLGPIQELVLIGGNNEHENQDLLTAIRGQFLPNCVIAYRSTPATGQNATRSALLDTLFVGRSPAAEGALYICENFACQAPVKGVNDIRQALANMTNR